MEHGRSVRGGNAPHDNPFIQAQFAMSTHPATRFEKFFTKSARRPCSSAVELPSSSPGGTACSRHRPDMSVFEHPGENDD